MRSSPMRRHQEQAGFTLLEVLLVVGILALLAAIVAPRLIGTQRRAQIDTTRSQVAMLDDVLDLYVQQNGCYPSTEQGLEALMVKPEDPPVPRAWAGPYLEQGALVDPWGNPYQYAYPGEHNVDKPDIWSLGPDGEDGTEDDIGNWASQTGEEEEGLESEELLEQESLPERESTRTPTRPSTTTRGTRTQGTTRTRTSTGTPTRRPGSTLTPREDLRRPAQPRRTELR